MEHSNLIQNVIHNRASKDDLAEFENRLKNDEEFAAQYQEALDLKAVAIDYKKATLRNIFQKQESKDVVSTTNKPKNNKLIKYLLPMVAAAAVIILALNVFDNNPDAAQLYDTNYEPYRNVMGGIERGEEIGNDMVSQAFYAYEIKNYEVSSQLFEKLYQTDQQTIYLFYLANSQLGQGNTDKAISLYQQHQSLQDYFYARSRWYLALAHLKNNQLEESKTILQEISKIESYNYINARELLQNLEDL